MKFGIGIDTGGTYTDAVIYDFEQRKVLDFAKALTTREDLSIGILNALDSLDVSLVSKAGMVSLSTTLATNACVENKGGRAKLLLIGVDRKIVEWVGGDIGLDDTKQVYHVDAEISIDGTITQAPDWESFIEESREWFSDAEALAIVQMHALSSNAALEKEAREVVSREYGIPVICGYELFADLNALKRGASALLNGRLIPVLAEFLSAIKKALGERGITAPVAIVHSDGSLMSERFTGVRPVETILCGPAASVMGASALLDEPEAVVVDMGGTTTDIALFRGGQPVRAMDGIRIGSWETFVKGVYVQTIGLGGDSAIRRDKGGKFMLDTVRVIPLCAAADRWPQIVPALRNLLDRTDKHSRPLHEFFALQKDISGSSKYSEDEKKFCAALENGPLIYAQAARAARKDLYSLRVDRLEKEGVVIRCGLTPTDIMHLKGDFNRFPKEASRLGARYVAKTLGTGVEELCDLVYETVSRRLYRQIAEMLLRENMPDLKAKGSTLGGLIDRAWEMSQGSHAEHVTLGLTTPSVLIGVGAPIHIFLPRVAKALGTRCVIPELAGVVNAVGAVAGNITASSTVYIKPQGEGFVAYNASLNQYFELLDEATALATEEARREAHEEAEKRGACGDLIVHVDVRPKIAETAFGSEVLVESLVTATAIGKIAL